MPRSGHDGRQGPLSGFGHESLSASATNLPLLPGCARSGPDVTLGKDAAFDARAPQLIIPGTSRLMGQRVGVTIMVCVVVLTAAIAEAQTYSAAKPRRKFVTLSLDWLYTQPLHFGEHPVADW